MTGHSRQIESFSFYPQEPCVPVFGLVAADDEGNMTVDAMDEDFALSPGWNDLAIDLSEMVEGSSYYVQWYYSGTNSWNGWYYHDLPGSDGYDDTGANGTGANGTDDAGWYEPYAIGHMIHFSIWMGEFDCDAHLYARVVNTTDGQWDEMGGYNVYIPGPCLKPFALQLNGSDLDNMASEGFELELGDNGMTWAFDNLEDGVDYRLEWYWNNGSYGNSDQHYFTYNETDGSGDLDWNLSVGIWDCHAEAQASLYYDGNGSYIHGTEHWYFHVPDCAQVQVNLTDANGNQFGSNYSDYTSIDDLTSELTWNISGLPEGYEYTLETRIYLNDIMHRYLYETFSDSPNATSSFSFDLDTTEACDLYFEFTLYYFDGYYNCLLYTSPSPRDVEESRMPSSA